MAQNIDTILSLLFNIYFYMIIIYVLMSWLPNIRESFIGELLGKLVEPYLSPFRKIIPPIFGMLDISPIVALFVLQFAMQGLRFIIFSLFF
ncbi:YggT family protein [Paenibacillus cellulositrophicus]|uniref:YggT family protein n=1 Tax=Paenibacillus TaxID=44249 RepID=UPI000E24EE8A|nr:YggT family protein [Paenibacillus sp. VMFN-D1]RED39184.1 YggT family protein [Paenibacillus sp. VMFN-D1]